MATMKVVTQGGKAKPAEDITIDLGRGAVAIARRLDAFEASQALAEAKGDLNALINNEEPAHPWSFNEDRVAILIANEEARAIALGWMRTVLVATMSVHTLTGIELEEQDEAGAVIGSKPMAPSFEAFELLFHDAMVEGRFRMSALRIETAWAEEKNGSRLAQLGRGPVVSNSADNASLTATPAPAGEGDHTQGTNASDARLSSTPPEAPPASTPGQSVATPDHGSAPASAASSSG